MSRSFNGTSDKVAATKGLASIGPTFTLSAWFQASSLSSANQHEIIIYQDAALGNFAALEFRPDLAVNTVNFNYTAGTYIATASSTKVTINTNTWYHLAATAVSSGVASIIYTNGANKTSGGPPTGTFSSFTANPINMGCFTNSGVFGGGFAGLVADTAFWNVQLTDSEILALGNGARPYNIRPASLKRYWPVDGIQSPEPDLSGNADNGALTGTASASGPPFMMFTPRTPLIMPSATVAASFQPAWATRNRIVIEGIGI